jgi:hypothetical protein
MFLLKNWILRSISLLDKSGDFLYLFNRLLRRVVIPNSSMSGSNLSEYLSTTAMNKNVLEFGCGGSTLLFATNSRQVTSVESDRYFSNAVFSQILALKQQDRVRVFWANIGPTKSYGQPWRFTSWIFSRRYSNYSLAVFDEFEDLKNVDMVFVDGRFRVACVMSSLLMIENDFILVIDDYFDRPYYHVVTEILGNPKSKVDNTSVFEINRSVLDFIAIENCLKLHLNEPR